MIRFMQNLMGM